MSGFRLAVVGGGVLGLSIAALAGHLGARATVFEPRALGDNASGVAAGMLSPAFEAALEIPADFDLYRRGYAAWPSFAETLRLGPLPDLAAGALYIDAEQALDRLAARLAQLEVAAERLSVAEAQALQPGVVVGPGGALGVAADGRLDPQRALHALAQRIRDDGGEILEAPWPGACTPGFDATLLAAGFDSCGWADQAPELAALRPIKGHVLHFRAGPLRGPTVRGHDGYAAPQPDGAVFGATMEAGRADLELDPAIVARLHAAAAALMPELACAPFVARAGVRAATPDGRPLVGRSVGGLHLAVGARRNGWLLAPLVAAAAVEGLQGAPARSEFDPAR